jgi:hypothetical protein
MKISSTRVDPRLSREEDEVGRARRGTAKRSREMMAVSMLFDYEFSRLAKIGSDEWHEQQGFTLYI